MVNVNNFAASDFNVLYREYLLNRNVPRVKIPPPPWEQTEDFPPQMLPDVYELLRKYRRIGN
jgi:hypothetical protein